MMSNRPKQATCSLAPKNCKFYSFCSLVCFMLPKDNIFLRTYYYTYRKYPLLLMPVLDVLSTSPITLLRKKERERAICC